MLADEECEIIGRAFEDVDVIPVPLDGRLRDGVEVHESEELLDEVRNRVCLLL